MKCSIVIPAHNGERYIRSAALSALEQSHPPEEVIVVDDASTDNTAAITREFGNRIRYYFNSQPTGFADAWNRAAGLATSDFVAILHQDDLLHPDYLMHMAKAIKQYPGVKHLYAACNYIDEEGDIIQKPPAPHSPDPVLYTGKDYAQRYLEGITTNRHIHRCPGVMTSRSLLLNECPYRKEAGHLADDDFFLRVGTYTDVVGISSPLASFRHHGGSETGQIELLSLKLAEAYLFQTRWYREHTSLLGPGDINKIDLQTVKFVNLLLFQSLLFKRFDWTKQACKLRADFENLRPHLMESALPFWARVMWGLAGTGADDSLTAGLYVKFLNSMRSLRDSGRSLVKRG